MHSIFIGILVVATANVLYIKGSELEPIIQSTDIVLARFCAAWSNECNFTRQDFVTASNIATSIKFIEIEIMNDAPTIKKYDFFNYPTVYAYINGTKHIHKGEYSLNALLSFIDKSRYPLVISIKSESMIVNDGLT
jgi:Thioredoxin